MTSFHSVSFKNYPKSSTPRNSIFVRLSLKIIWGIVLTFFLLLDQQLVFCGNNSSQRSPNISENQENVIKLQKYPAIAKIICQGRSAKSQNQEMTSLFYGSGVYVAGQGDFGIVLTNNHVVSEAEGKIQVRFANFASEGIVLLIDEVWDIAAVIIKKPPFKPVPISLEVPLIGEKLWLAGFGQKHDLSGFCMVSGIVYKYAAIDLRPDIPAETLMIETGIRHGDSGGPILNQYGELAGQIWGSDGTITTGTFCLRLQAFLTQTQFQLKNLNLSCEEFFASSKPLTPKKILMETTPAGKALEMSGIYPISAEPVYDIPLHNIDRLTIMDSTEKENPPYPAILSPTYISLKKAIGREHPEAYYSSNSQTLVQVSNIAEIIQANIDSSIAENAPPDIISPAKLIPDSSTTAPIYAAPYNSQSDNESNSSDNSSVAPETIIISPDPESENNDSDSETTFQENKEQTKSYNDIQIVIVVVIIFFLFFNAVRLLSIAREKD